jgi:mono/diheme cytochrome c family protein
LLALLLAGCDGAGSLGEAPPADPGTRAMLGREWFGRHCVSCHGESARGDGPLAEALVTRPADLTAIAARRGGRFDPDETAAYIDGRMRVLAHGPSEMPVWGRMVPDRFGREGVEEPLLQPGVVALLVEYLRSIQSEQTARASPGCATPCRPTPSRGA